MSKRAHKEQEDESRERKRKPPMEKRHEDLFRRVPSDLRKEILSMQEHEERMLTALQDDEMAQEFLLDPAAALAKMGIDVPPLLKKRLKTAGIQDFQQVKSFRLPNGQVITPKVTIRFTKS